MIPKPGQWAILRHPTLPQYFRPDPVEVLSARADQVRIRRQNGQPRFIAPDNILAAFDSREDAATVGANLDVLRRERMNAESEIEREFAEKVRRLLEAFGG